MTTAALVLAAVAYGLFYAAAPGRQAAAPPPRTRGMQVCGAMLTVVAFGLAIAGAGPGVGPVLVLTVMMSVASVLALAGPMLLPWAVSNRSPSSSDR